MIDAENLFFREHLVSFVFQRHRARQVVPKGFSMTMRDRSTRPASPAWAHDQVEPAFGGTLR